MTHLAPQQTEILQALSSGLGITAAAEAAGIPLTTVHNWCRMIPDFRDTLQAVNQARAGAIREAMHQLVQPSLTILAKILSDESASPSLRMRTAMAVIKFSTTVEKAPAAKEITTEILATLSYEAGVKQGVHFAAARSEPQEDEIHHNSSLSSLSSLSSQNGAPGDSAPCHPGQTPRNSPCPCGSGNKFKRCCGKNAPPVLGRTA